MFRYVSAIITVNHNNITNMYKYITSKADSSVTQSTAANNQVNFYRATQSARS